MPSIKIDIITEDQKNGEFALILVEEGPWPDADAGWDGCLSRIQSRIYNAMDVAIEGHLATKFPDAKGKNVRVQIDCPQGAPPPVTRLVSNLRKLLTKEDNEYRLAIEQSEFVNQLRIVMGHELGQQGK